MRRRRPIGYACGPEPEECTREDLSGGFVMLKLRHVALAVAALSAALPATQAPAQQKITIGVSLAQDDNPFYIHDYAPCVMCWRCIQVCAEAVQYTFALTWGGRGIGSRVATFFEEDMPDTSCVFCGNCVGVCPTGALKGKVEYELEKGG